MTEENSRESQLEALGLQEAQKQTGLSIVQTLLMIITSVAVLPQIVNTLLYPELPNQITLVALSVSLVIMLVYSFQKRTTRSVDINQTFSTRLSALMRIWLQIKTLGSGKIHDLLVDTYEEIRLFNILDAINHGKKDLAKELSKSRYNIPKPKS